jgi:hypothetical protein
MQSQSFLDEDFKKKNEKGAHSSNLRHTSIFKWKKTRKTGCVLNLMVSCIRSNMALLLQI